ncbi:hypothetical protein FSARC_9161 [Fusarium sarcochroum]|uniref:Uncharacterized protein n=1 Tax=Fusarium sarcochroum TaxID=1208366 RepID=A0A8H4TRI9_9HYPO|nr:hypothetical protein FSARC_9161 [Fusarium sarcochroum]
MATQEEKKKPIIVSGWDNDGEEPKQRVEVTFDDPNHEEVPIAQLVAQLAQTVSAQQVLIKQLQETTEAMKKEIELLKAAGGRSRTGSLDLDECDFDSDDSEKRLEREIMKDMYPSEKEEDSDEEYTRMDED